MTDYDGFFLGLVLYFGVVPGLVGAGLAAVWAWQRGAPPARIAGRALGGFVIAAALCLLVVAVFLKY